MKVALIVLNLVIAVGWAGEPPSEWKMTFGDDAKRFWGACFDDEGRFQATSLIRLRYDNSPHDGDAQSDVAKLLTQAPDDPHEALHHFLKSPNPYDRAFVIQVIILLGDCRFIPILEGLTKDTATIMLWPGLGFDTVGEGARSALDSLRRGNSYHTPAPPLAKWLIEARKPGSR